METLERRVAALEVSARRWRTLSLSLIAGTAGLVGLGAARFDPPARSDDISELVRARRIEILGVRGSPTIILESAGEAGAIRIHNDGGRQLVRLGTEASEDSAGLIETFRGDDESRLVSIGANRIGRGEITTFGPRGEAFVSIGSGGVGGIIATHSETGRDLVRIGSVNGNGTLRTFNNSGEALVNLGVTRSGQGTVATYDGRGQTLVQIGATTRDGRAAISLLDGAESRPVAQMFVDERGNGEILSLSPAGEGRGLSPQGVLPVRPSASLTLSQASQ